MSNHGYFSGNPKTEWLSNPHQGDRNMKLLEDFYFVDPDGDRWLAPKGSIINGASIPRFLWSSVGSPFVGDYRNASVVHDVGCDDPTQDRKAVDKMFYHACRAGGCSSINARKLYLGVRIGAWASQNNIDPEGAFSTFHNQLALEDVNSFEDLQTFVDSKLV